MVTWEEAEDGSDGAEAGVVGTKRTGKDGGAANQNANVSDQQWVDEREVRQPANSETTDYVDDADDGN